MKEYKIIKLPFMSSPIKPKDLEQMNYTFNENAKEGYKVISILNHGAARHNGIDEEIIIVFERDIPDEE